MFCLVFSVDAQETDSLFMSAALSRLKNAREYTLRVADLMPADKYGYKPTPEEMAFGEQLVHLAANLGWLSSTYLQKGNNPVSKEDARLTDKAAIRAVLERSYDYAIDAFSRFNARELGSSVKFFVSPMNNMQIINLINDHQTHHRGQMMVYLRLNGLTPPKYVGW
jgi:uncharacterized damage-inducible protein DinB